MTAALAWMRAHVERIVFEGEVPAARPEDAHDVLGTYRLVSDEAEMRQVRATYYGMMAEVDHHVDRKSVV